MAIKLNRLEMKESFDEIANQVSKSIRVAYFTANDDIVSYYGTNWRNQKELRFIKKAVDIPSGIISLRAETMSTNGTTEVGFFIDNDINPRKILFTEGTSWELLEGTMYVGNLEDGTYLLKMYLRNIIYGTSYQRLLEIHGISY